MPTLTIKRRWNEHRKDFDIFPCDDYSKLLLRNRRKTFHVNDINFLKEIGFDVYDCDEEIKKL